MSRPSAVVVFAAVSVLALLAGYFGLRRAPASPSPAPPAAAETTNAAPPSSSAIAPLVVRVEPAASAAAPAVGVSDPALADEPTLMATLRRLRSSDPTRTLRLTREADARFGKSADAAERAWFEVKALTDLGRHDEARVAGRALVDQYRDSRWAEDVYRHLFVNPGTHPAERGYGKQLESDP